MTILGQLLGRRRREEEAPRALYEAVIAEARDPDWYWAGAVPDTLDGRFDMVAIVLVAVLLRLEAAGDEGREPAARLTELFISDMDGQLRESGIGDLVVGKHIGRMMGALGGRLGAYRAGLAGDADLGDALRRNLYRGAPVAEQAVAHSGARLRALAARLGALPLDAMLAGSLG
jgi:cytochrome b pre-mRNA-processing protein 3